MELKEMANLSAEWKKDYQSAVFETSDTRLKMLEQKSLLAERTHKRANTLHRGITNLKGEY